MKLVVPILQKSLNVLLRMHWAAFAKEQQKIDMMVHWAYNQQGGGKHFRGKTVSIIYTLYFKDEQRRDLSNYAQKMMDDSLVKEKIIDDDNSKVILRESVEIRCDRKSPRTVITVLDCIKKDTADLQI